MRVVFPARAGMIPEVNTGIKDSASIPRESGDDPLSSS